MELIFQSQPNALKGGACYPNPRPNVRSHVSGWGTSRSTSIARRDTDILVCASDSNAPAGMPVSRSEVERVVPNALDLPGASCGLSATSSSQRLRGKPLHLNAGVQLSWSYT